MTGLSDEFGLRSVERLLHGCTMHLWVLLTARPDGTGCHTLPVLPCTERKPGTLLTHSCLPVQSATAARAAAPAADSLSRLFPARMTP